MPMIEWYKKAEEQDTQVSTLQPGSLETTSELPNVLDAVGLTNESW